MRDLEEFLAAYIECALWSSTGDNDEPLDRNYGREDIAPETLESMRNDCIKFLDDNNSALQGAFCENINCNASLAGHDFWLTRCGHGAGFWDGDWPMPFQNTLTASSHDFGNVDLYVGDDGKVYA